MDIKKIIKTIINSSMSIYFIVYMKWANFLKDTFAKTHTRKIEILNRFISIKGNG